MGDGMIAYLILAIVFAFGAGAVFILIAAANGMSDSPMIEKIPQWPALGLLVIAAMLFAEWWFRW